MLAATAQMLVAVITYQTADDNLALSSQSRSSDRGDSCSPRSPRYLSLLGDTADGSGGRSLRSGGGSGATRTRGAAVTATSWLGVLHDLVERLVELARHVDCCFGCEVGLKVDREGRAEVDKQGSGLE